MFLLVLFIIYYVNKSGTIEGLAEAEAEVIEQSEKDSEKEFRETLYDFKMKYFTYVRKRFASLVRKTIFKIVYCQNEDALDSTCLTSDESEIYQEMQSGKSTRGKVYQELFDIYKRFNLSSGMLKTSRTFTHVFYLLHKLLIIGIEFL